jgi:hypothetical protein
MQRGRMTNERVFSSVCQKMVQLPGTLRAVHRAVFVTLWEAVLKAVAEDLPHPALHSDKTLKPMRFESAGRQK